MPPINFDRIKEIAYNTFVEPAKLIAECAIDIFSRPAPQQYGVNYNGPSDYVRNLNNEPKISPEALESMIRRRTFITIQGEPGKSELLREMIRLDCTYHPSESHCVRLYREMRAVRQTPYSRNVLE